MLVQKRSGQHTGWASYTLSAVEESFPDLQAAPFPATHDQRQEVEAGEPVPDGRLAPLAQTWIYASGKPYTAPIGLETVDRPFGGTIDRVVAGSKNGGRLPAYHRLDVAVNREFYVQSSMRGVFSLTGCSTCTTARTSGTRSSRSSRTKSSRTTSSSWAGR